jgi:hypothetical protein
MHLIEDGYIASRSRHNLGLAVDLTLVDFSVGGREVDMGTPFDTFSEQGTLGQCVGRHDALPAVAASGDGGRKDSSSTTRSGGTTPSMSRIR